MPLVLGALLEMLVPQVLAFVMNEIRRRQEAGEALPTEEELRAQLAAKRDTLVAQADDFLRSKGIDPNA